MTQFNDGDTVAAAVDQFFAEGELISNETAGTIAMAYQSPGTVGCYLAGVASQLTADKCPWETIPVDDIVWDICQALREVNELPSEETAPRRRELLALFAWVAYCWEY